MKIMEKFVDNFELFRNNLEFSEKNIPEYFYFVQILTRPKDNVNSPNGSNKNRLCKYFTIDSLEKLNLYENEIKHLCDYYNARAYIHPTKRSYKEVATEMLRDLIDSYTKENYLGMKSEFSTAAGKSFMTKDKKFIVDVDEDMIDRLDEIVEYISKNCEPYHKKEDMLIVPTLHGAHVVCKPFNTMKFKQVYQTIDVHKNNPTLLYYKKVL